MTTMDCLAVPKPVVRVVFGAYKEDSSLPGIPRNVAIHRSEMGSTMRVVGHLAAISEERKAIKQRGQETLYESIRSSEDLETDGHYRREE